MKGVKLLVQNVSAVKSLPMHFDWLWLIWHYCSAPYPLLSCGLTSWIHSYRFCMKEVFGCYHHLFRLVIGGKTTCHYHSMTNGMLNMEANYLIFQSAKRTCHWQWHLLYSLRFQQFYVNQKIGLHFTSRAHTQANGLIIVANRKILYVFQKQVGEPKGD